MSKTLDMDSWAAHRMLEKQKGATPAVAPLRQCVRCGGKGDWGHKNCSRCRAEGGLYRACTKCGVTGRYKSKGMCVACYFRARRRMQSQQSDI